MASPHIKAYVSSRLTKGVHVVLERTGGKPFIILRGPNGAGKSTLLKAFMGLDQGSTARLERSYQDRSQDYFPQKERAFVRYMPQDPNEALFPRLSVADNIRLLSQLLHIPATFADSIQEFTGDHARPLEDGLSGGEKKLLLLEAILNSIPAADESKIVFVLLDEPFAGLHPTKTRIVLEKLNTKAIGCRDSKNITFLIVDHDHIAVSHSALLWKGPDGVEILASHVDQLSLATKS